VGGLITNTHTGIGSNTISDLYLCRSLCSASIREGSCVDPAGTMLVLAGQSLLTIEIRVLVEKGPIY
jgi:hypothetical protein